MSSSRKNKKSPASEGGGITVLELPPELASETAPGESKAGGATVQVSTEVIAVGASVWQRARRVTAVWGKSENRNSWVAIGGVGWKKLADSSDSANIALTILASQALQTTRNIDYREESDGMIHEIYVW